MTSRKFTSSELKLQSREKNREQLVDKPSVDKSVVDGLVQKFNNDQVRFLEEQEYQDYYWSLDSLQFEVENEAHDKQVFPLIPIGTWSPHSEEFTWAWAHPKFPAASKNAALSLKILEKQFANPVFGQMSFDCPHVNLDEILAMAHHHFGGKVVFKEKNMEPWLFLAVLAHRPQ